MELIVNDYFKSVESGEKYLEIKICNEPDSAVCVIDCGDRIYLFRCSNGDRVYSLSNGGNSPVRDLTGDEYGQIIDFARKRFFDLFQNL